MGFGGGRDQCTPHIYFWVGVLRKGDKRNISLDAVEALAKECNVSYCEVDPDDKDTLDVVSLWLYVCASLLFKTTT